MLSIKSLRVSFPHMSINWWWGNDGPITLMEKTLKKVDEAGSQYVYHVYELPRLAGFKTDL